MVFVPCLVTRCMLAELPSHIAATVTTLALSVHSNVPDQSMPGWYLSYDQNGLSLCEFGGKSKSSLRIDFVDGKLGFRRRRQEAKPDIIKALGIQGTIKPLVWDQTAGLGQDAFVIAQYAGAVTMFERNPVVRALLDDAVHRASCAASADEGLQAVMNKLTLSSCSAKESQQSPDVIYLDPMFPARRKSAKVKKGMQVFHQLVGDDPDADELLEPATERASYRVVVKRPVTAPPLNQQAPSFEIKGKTIRFDVYVKSKMPDHLDRTK